MKFKLLSFGLFSLAAVSPFFVPSLSDKVMALGCVATDVAVQLDVSGSRTRPEQSNNADQRFGENCVGNSSTNRGTQVNVGSEAARQRRNSTQVVGDGPLSNKEGEGDVGVKLHVPLHIYNPAEDRNFMKKYSR